MATSLSQKEIDAYNYGWQIGDALGAAWTGTVNDAHPFNAGPFSRSSYPELDFSPTPLRILHDEMRPLTRKQYELLLQASRCEYCGVKRLGGNPRCSGCGNVL